MYDMRFVVPDVFDDARMLVLSDPWGHEFNFARVQSTDGETLTNPPAISDPVAVPRQTSVCEYVYSMGPDGVSATFGADPDDLTPRTHFRAWLEAICPVRLVERIFLVSSSIAGTLLLTRRKRSKLSDEAEQVADGKTPEAPQPHP
jgi:hypothetical protein